MSKRKNNPEFSCRLEDPEKFTIFRRKSEERQHRGKFYDVIYGKHKKSDIMHQQAFRYPSPLWTKQQAMNHCRIHGGKFDTFSGNGTSINPKKKQSKKKAIKNPVKKKISIKEKIYQAIKLFKKFRGEDPKYVDKVNFPVYNVAMMIGDCDGILYTTTRDGKKESYIHKFSKSARPLLVSSHDGKQIYLVGGKYNFTEDGIVDKKGR